MGEKKTDETGEMMSDLNVLQKRLEEALAILEAAGPGNGAETSDRIAALEAENTRLAEDLATLEQERSKDLAQLDTLISQLRPLIEEAG